METDMNALTPSSTLLWPSTTGSDLAAAVAFDAARSRSAVSEGASKDIDLAVVAVVAAGAAGAVVVAGAGPASVGSM